MIKYLTKKTFFVKYLIDVRYLAQTVYILILLVAINTVHQQYENINNIKTIYFASFLINMLIYNVYLLIPGGNIIAVFFFSSLTLKLIKDFSIKSSKKSKLRLYCIHFGFYAFCIGCLNTHLNGYCNIYTDQRSNIFLSTVDYNIVFQECTNNKSLTINIKNIYKVKYSDSQNGIVPFYIFTGSKCSNLGIKNVMVKNNKFFMPSENAYRTGVSCFLLNEKYRTLSNKISLHENSETIKVSNTTINLKKSQYNMPFYLSLENKKKVFYSSTKNINGIYVKCKVINHNRKCFTSVIGLNQPVHCHPYVFFQSSYTTDNIQTSVILVSSYNMLRILQLYILTISIGLILNISHRMR